MSAAAFCLGRIGGPKAEAFLGKLVRTKVDFKEDEDWLWEKVVCFAYAECAKERAVSNLVELYDRCNGKYPEMQRWAVIAALAKTQSRGGVIFELDQT